MINRIEDIKNKGFSFVPEQRGEIDYQKAKIGVKTLEDAVLDLNSYKNINSEFSDKEKILKTIAKGDVPTMRAISNFYMRVNGIYSRLVSYAARLYKYDWVVNPHIVTEKQKDYTKIKTDFYKVLDYLDGTSIKKVCGDIALQVIKDGCFYGYVVDMEDGASIQELPSLYCRSRFKVGAAPAIEFNMKFFNDYFPDPDQRLKMLNLFPKDFKKGYGLYLDGKLVPQFRGDSVGWYLLDPNCAFKININDTDQPLFISVIPTLLDLDAAQGLDRKKMMQKLLKIIIQKLPLDKNGELLFDIDEAAELHNNAVRMLNKAIGIDVLTTFAEVEVADMADNVSSTAVDELEKVERAVFNEAGVSQNLFNTDGNLAMDKSVANDEAMLSSLVLQFENLLNKIVSKKFNLNKKKVIYKVEMLPTTIYNYKDLAKSYKEQTQLGYSRMLPPIALGQTQSSILAAAHFENKVLDLNSIFVPPMSSNTMSSQNLKTKTNTGSGDGQVGRPEKADDEKAEKTIANKESMS